MVAQRRYGRGLVKSSAGLVGYGCLRTRICGRLRTNAACTSISNANLNSSNVHAAFTCLRQKPDRCQKSLSDHFR
jgi:hypothetical protein